MSAAPVFADPLLDAAAAMIHAALPADITLHDTDASAVAGQPAAYPYVVISAAVPLSAHDALDACATGSTGLARVTHVALTPGAVRALVASTRGVLDGARLPLPGGDEIRLEDHQGVLPDRDVKVVTSTSTTAWPFYAVDIYRLSTSI